MFDSISELQKKVSYNPLDSFLVFYLACCMCNITTRENCWYEDQQSFYLIARRM
jgi:hypothetical protein